MKLHIRTFAASVDPEHPMDRTPILVARTVADLVRHSVEMHETEIRKLRELEQQEPHSYQMGGGADESDLHRWLRPRD